MRVPLRVELPELCVNSSFRQVSSSQAAGGALCSDDLGSVGVFLFSMGESCISRGKSCLLPTIIFARNLWKSNDRSRHRALSNVGPRLVNPEGGSSDAES